MKLYHSIIFTLFILVVNSINLSASDQTKTEDSSVDYCQKLSANAEMIHRDNEFRNIIIDGPQVCEEITLMWRFANCALKGNQDKCKDLYERSQSWKD